MKISDYFENEYLTVGKTRDNTMFCDCDDELLKKLYENLLVSNEKYVLAQFDENDCKIVDNLLLKCDNEVIKLVLTRNYICAKIMLELKRIQNKDTNFLERHIKEFLSEDINALLKNYKNFVYPEHIEDELNENGFKELIFVVSKSTNQNLQKAINIFLTSRTKYCIKLFTDGSDLSTRYDQCGHLIEVPHDVRKISIEDEKEKI